MLKAEAALVSLEISFNLNTEMENYQWFSAFPLCGGGNSLRDETFG